MASISTMAASMARLVAGSWLGSSYWKDHGPPEPGLALTPQQRFHTSGLFNVSPDDHLRLRRLINRAFTRRGVEAQPEPFGIS